MAKKRRGRRKAGGARMSGRRAPGPRARRRRSVYRVNARRRSGRRRRYSANPSFRGIFGMLQRGVADGVGIVAGKAAAGIVANQLPVLIKDSPNADAVLKKVAGAAIVGFVAQKALGALWASRMVAGAIAGVIEAQVKTMKIPYVSEGLSDYPSRMGFSAYPMVRGMSAYPMLSAYPQRSTLAGYPGVTTVAPGMF